MRRSLCHQARLRGFRKCSKSLRSGVMKIFLASWDLVFCHLLPEAPSRPRRPGHRRGSRLMASDSLGVLILCKRPRLRGWQSCWISRGKAKVAERRPWWRACGSSTSWQTQTCGKPVGGSRLARASLRWCRAVLPAGKRLETRRESPHRCRSRRWHPNTARGQRRHDVSEGSGHRLRRTDSSPCRYKTIGG